MSQIKVIGGEVMGDKTSQLIDKEPAIIDAGFEVVEGFSLAYEIFIDTVARAHKDFFYPSPPIPQHKLLRLTKWDEEQQEKFQEISLAYPRNHPLVVRSSMEGDSAGTGVYESLLVANQPQLLAKATSQVIASYFTPEAVNFRSQAGHGDKFDVLFNPIIGQQVEYGFAPVLSGFGYTSTSKGEGYIGMVPGLGGGVNSIGVQHISLDILNAGERYQTLGGVLADFHFKSPHNQNSMTFREGIQSSRAYDGLYIEEIQPNGEITMGKNNILSKYGSAKDLIDLVENLDLGDFFSKMKILEENRGSAQYLEWALTFKDERPVYTLTQISDFVKDLGEFDFSDLENILFDAKYVVGTKASNHSNLVYIFSDDAEQKLKQYNSQNKDYIVVVPSGLVTGASREIVSPSSYDNASVVIGMGYCHHNGDIPSHFLGRHRMSGKRFGHTLEYLGESDGFKYLMQTADGNEDFGICRGNFEVRSSEKQDRLVVSVKN